MDTDLKKQIYKNMQIKETQELVQIWKLNDRAIWTEEALEVVQEILVERLGALPSEDESGAEDDESQDVYHHFGKLSAISSWANTLAGWFLFAGSTMIVANILAAIQFYFQPTTETFSLESIITFLKLLLSALQYLFFYVLLRGISEGIYLLIDIENNTRRAARDK